MRVLEYTFNKRTHGNQNQITNWISHLTQMIIRLLTAKSLAESVSEYKRTFDQKPKHRTQHDNKTTIVQHHTKINQT